MGFPRNFSIFVKITRMNDLCFFVSDLHGAERRYEVLFQLICERKPGLVLMGGDLLPHPRKSPYHDFLQEYLVPRLQSVKDVLKEQYPLIGIILGNDDQRICEPSALEGMAMGLWEYLHLRRIPFGPYEITGYSYIPPTPFRLKDWERYDVSRYTDPGCTSPAEGTHTVEISPDEIEQATILKDLEGISRQGDPSKTIYLFHAPPYQSYLDRAGLDGIMIDHVPADVHVGSIAIQRFINDFKPYITLHGHIHESARLTGHWSQIFGTTHSFSAAHDGAELSLISFLLERPQEAQRELL